MNDFRLTGLLAAPHPPFGADGELDLDRVEMQAAALADDGVSGAFVCGTSGEFSSLTTDERMRVAQRWVDVAGKRLKVVVHVGGTCLAESRALAAHAAKIGAVAIGAMSPYFFRPSKPADLAAYLAKIASAAPALPFYYYHIPVLTFVDLSVGEVLAAAAPLAPNLRGAKFTGADLMDFAQCVQLDGGRFDILLGRDETLLAGLAMGARGAVGTTYNYAAPLYLEIIRAFEAGDLAAARTAQAKSMAFIGVMKRYGGLAASKPIMKMLGLDCGPARPPLPVLSPQQCRDLQRDLEQVGFFEHATKAGRK